MDRSSSFGSQSSAGSALTSRSATTKIVTEAEREQGLDNQGQSLLTALFGALYTLAKEKINDTASIAMLAIAIDFLLIFTLLLMPEYPWEVNSGLWIYKVFYYIQIHLPLADTGYTFYLAIFYVLVATLYLSVAICVWVGWCFMNDNFPFLWPIKVARLVVSLFVSMLYIASLNIFLMACACEKHNGVWVHSVFHVECLAYPHIVHAAFSIVSGVVFFVVALLLVLGDHELNPMSKSLLATPHSMCELRALLCKTVITFSDILLKPWPHIQVVLYAISCGLLFYYHARMVPNYVPWINVLRGGLNMVLAWVALMSCVLTYTVNWDVEYMKHPHWDKDAYRGSMTTLMAAGCPLLFLVGAGICWAHLVYAWRTALKFKVLPPGVKPRTIHRFMDDFDVEIASRIGRIWDEEGALDPTALELAENVLRAGVAMKPNSVFTHIAYSNFLIDVRHNAQAGWSHLEMAKKLEPNLSYQFSIFSRHQEHKQKSAGGGGGEGSTDLVSYVEFQKNYRSLLVYHKASLVANREFWRLLTKDTIPMERLGHSFKRIDEMESMAEKTYKLVLDRYPTNAKLLKSYGKFLENVKNDPWGAARYYAEAEKQEELAESQAAEIRVADENGLSSLVDDKSSLITIDANGLIQTVNKAACQMLGYKKGELEGKNVSMLMPAPFSIRHNGYLRNHITTGQVKILNTTREVVALHKDRYVFPVSLYVGKFSGDGADSVFMGIMKPVESDPGMIRAWMLTTGTMLCADQSFLDYAGWDPDELVGRAFSSLGVDSQELDDLIAMCARYHEDELAAGAVQISTNIKHKFADSVPVHIKFELGGTDTQRILVAQMRRLVETVAMAAFNSKGRCLYANSPLASMLGHKVKDMRSKDITQLLPQPYGALHIKWIRDAEHLDSKKTPTSCRNSITSVMLSSNGTPVHVQATITPINSSPGQRSSFSGGTGGDNTWAVNVKRSSLAQLLSERRLQLLVGPDGKIVWAASGTPNWLFGWDPAELAGVPLSRVVDVFTEFENDLSAGGDVAAALAALVSRANSRPGSSWRVGVGKDLQPEDLAAVNSMSGSKSGLLIAPSADGRMVVRKSMKDRIKPAIMVVLVPTEEAVSEEVLAAAAGHEAAVCIELWRADMLLGVAEIVEGCNFVRVEHSIGLLFGAAHTNFYQTTLKKWIKLPHGTDLADLMGTKWAKKGGLRKSSRLRVGPTKVVTGVHLDKRPLQLQLQATVKETGNENRLVLALKLISPLIGPPNLLQSLIAFEVSGGSHPGGQSRPFNNEIGKLISLEGGKSMRHTDSRVSRGRSIKLEGPDGMLDMDARPSPKGRAPALLVNDDEHSQGPQLQSLLTPRKQHFAQVSLGLHSPEAEDDKEPQHNKEMALSSDSELREDERQPHHRATKGKKHLTEEEAEALYEAKGAKKAKDWIESGFGGIKQVDNDRDTSLPGAVEDEHPLQLVHGRNHDEGKSEGSGADDDDVAAAADARPADAGSEGSASAASAADGGLVSDYSRGKRLRKLMRLLSSKAALQVVTGFRLKVVLLAFGILVLHVGSFAAIVGYMNTATGYLQDLTAAGTIMDTVNRAATLGLVLEAAQRSFGFLPSDTEQYAAELDDVQARFDTLHQGIYLGFGGLRALTSPQLRSLWHDPIITAVTFLNGADPTNTTIQQLSLFNLGTMYTTAARDVHYAALHPDTSIPLAGQLALNRQWLFLQANGPGELFQAYTKSLDFMVLRAQDQIHVLRSAVLALLLIEGLLIMVVAVGLVMRMLNSISIHRQALFSVFLAIPNNYLRTLANRGINIGDESDDDDDEEDKAILEAEDKKRKQRRDARQDADELKVTNRRASFATGVQNTDGAVFVGVNQNTGGPKSKGAVGGVDNQMDRSRLFNGKQLVTSLKSAYQLSWPFLLWGMLVMVLYGVSYQQLGNMNSSIIAIKLAERSIAQASKLTYYTTRIALEDDMASRQALQSQLWNEGMTLDKIYHTALYGGKTLPDSAADGSRDDSTGSLFINSYHKQLLFQLDGCLRYDQASCLPEDNPYYVVSHHGIDPMVQRLIQESQLISLATPQEVNPYPTAERCLAANIVLHDCRFACIWSITWKDLHDGFGQLENLYFRETAAAYNRQRTIHVVLLIIMVIGGGMFLIMMLRPFLKHISKESRRCAELLVQLPPDMDVEGMVAATWTVVKEEQLIAERSGRTFINNVGGLGSVLRGLSIMSLSNPFGSQPNVPAGTAIPTRPGGDGGRLFTQRPPTGSEPGSGWYGAPAGYDQPGGSRVEAGRRGGAAMGPSADRGARGGAQRPYGGSAAGSNRDGMPGGSNDGSQVASGYAGSAKGSASGGRGAGRSGPGDLRLRRGGQIKAPSRRAVHPAADDGDS